MDESPSRMAGVHAAGRRLLGRERFERLVRLFRRRMARGGSMFPDYHLLEVFSATGTCSIRHARERLGYEPEFDLMKGLAATESDLSGRAHGV